MHDEDTLDDSWFDRPVKGQALTVEMVQAALRTPETELGPSFEGLDDSWFDKPARSTARSSASARNAER